VTVSEVNCHAPGIITNDNCSHCALSYIIQY